MEVSESLQNMLNQLIDVNAPRSYTVRWFEDEKPKRKRPEPSIGWVRDDCGRTVQDRVGDCCVRALAHAEGLTYAESEEYFNTFTDYKRSGVPTSQVRKLMKDLGWTWIEHRMSLVKPSAKDQLPTRCILSFRTHVAWYADGTIHDLFNPLTSKGMTQCNGYYVKGGY